MTPLYYLLLTLQVLTHFTSTAIRYFCFPETFFRPMTKENAYYSYSTSYSTTAAQNVLTSTYPVVAPNAAKSAVRSAGWFSPIE